MKTNVQKHIMHDSNAIAVYCGTYHKYNNGSIDGAWLDLSTFNDAADFFATCKDLHDDEADPEYMFQDYQGFPDWMYRESMGTEQVQEIINFAHATEEEKAKILCEDEEEQKNPSIIIEDYSEKAIAVKGETYAISEQLKAIGGAWNKFKKIWFFSKKKREAVEELVSKYAEGIVATVKEKESENKQYKEALNDFCKAVNDCGYYSKEFVGAVKVRDKFYLIDKPSIGTRFCFHDEGPQYELYKSLCNDNKKMEQYFISENLDSFDRDIKNITEHGAYIAKYYNDSTPRLGITTDYWTAHRDNLEQLTKDECESIKKALEWGKALFKKRLESYLKRYGTSKLHTWTYWADA